MSGQAWSADREFAVSRLHYQPVPRAELRLAGMSLASVTNVPQAQVPDMATAITQYLDSSSHGVISDSLSYPWIPGFTHAGPLLRRVISRSPLTLDRNCRIIEICPCKSSFLTSRFHWVPEPGPCVACGYGH